MVISMSGPTPTLEQLWKTLGLDSLPPDAGSAADLSSTRVPDWDQATLRSEQVAAPPPTERIDLPRISLTPPTTDALEKSVIHRDLVVTGLLGEGGMGRVLLAHQASLGRDVAVKVPRANASPGTINALVSEARITGGLEHPGVIPVYSLASDTQGHPALVMKRVDGVSWSMLIRHAEDPAWSCIASSGDRLDTHVELLRQVCNAIAFAHRKGVLHRDIKPSNVLIGEFGEVYVADWGIAIRKAAAGEVRKPGLVGSPVYLAPEMVTGDEAQLDERTDVFLLGATLYELLTGQPVFRRSSDFTTSRAVMEEQVPPPSSLRADLPPELDLIVARAMAKAPSDRYGSCLELRRALERLQRGPRVRLDDYLVQLFGQTRLASSVSPPQTPLTPMRASRPSTPSAAGSAAVGTALLRRRGEPTLFSPGAAGSAAVGTALLGGTPSSAPGEGKVSDSCPHTSSCAIFPQFKLVSLLAIWKLSYCDANYSRCVRYQMAKAGKVVSLAMLPNGTLLTPRRK